jgi:hypothetical protein
MEFDCWRCFSLIGGEGEKNFEGIVDETFSVGLKIVQRIRHDNKFDCGSIKIWRDSRTQITRRKISRLISRRRNNENCF